MRLVWYQRKDGLWNAMCACNAAVCGVRFEQRADAEAAHVAFASVERAFRAENPAAFAGNLIPPKLPELDPNRSDPPVFP